MLEVNIVSKKKVRVRDLQPGMYVKKGNGHWTVEANLGWVLFHAPYRNDAMAQVVAFTKAKRRFFIWAYSNRDATETVVEYDRPPIVQPYWEEVDDRSPYI